MSRTIRNHPDNACLRNQRNRPHKVERSLLEDLAEEFDINFGNRFKVKERLPEPWDDKCVAALHETSPQWKNNAPPRPKQRYHPI